MCAALSVLTTAGIIAVLAFETYEFLQEVPILDFLTGTEWTPLFANQQFGVLPLVVGTMLVFFWKYYTKIRWNHWWLGIIVGVVGIFQWVGMQLFLQKHFELFRPKPGDAFNPFEYFSEPVSLWASTCTTATSSRSWTSLGLSCSSSWTCPGTSSGPNTLAPSRSTSRARRSA